MPVKIPRGRPIQYERDRTLRRVTEAFWQAGFAATSLDELSTVTGMTRPSLAGAFGNKETLFLITLNRYREENSGKLRHILNGDRSLHIELSEMFSTSLDLYLGPSNTARGCLLIGVGLVEAVQRPRIRTAVLESLTEFRQIIEQRLALAITLGQLRPDANPANLADMLSALMHSLAVRARAGEKRQILEGVSLAAVELICVKPTNHGSLSPVGK